MTVGGFNPFPVVLFGDATGRGVSGLVGWTGVSTGAAVGEACGAGANGGIIAGAVVGLGTGVGVAVGVAFGVADGVGVGVGGGVSTTVTFGFGASGLLLAAGVGVATTVGKEFVAPVFSTGTVFTGDAVGTGVAVAAGVGVSKGGSSGSVAVFLGTGGNVGGTGPLWGLESAGGVVLFVPGVSGGMLGTLLLPELVGRSPRGRAGVGRAVEFGGNVRAGGVFVFAARGGSIFGGTFPGGTVGTVGVGALVDGALVTATGGRRGGAFGATVGLGVGVAGVRLIVSSPSVIVILGNGVARSLVGESWAATGRARKPVAMSDRTGLEKKVKGFMFSGFGVGAFSSKWGQFQGEF